MTKSQITMIGTVMATRENLGVAVAGGLGLVCCSNELVALAGR